MWCFLWGDIYLTFLEGIFKISVQAKSCSITYSDMGKVFTLEGFDEKERERQEDERLVRKQMFVAVIMRHGCSMRLVNSASWYWCSSTRVELYVLMSSPVYLDQLSVDQPTALLKAANVWGALRGKLISVLDTVLLILSCWYFKG